MNLPTSRTSSVEMRHRGYAVALLLGLFVQTAGAQDKILVGVISPIDGKSAVGVDHEETARFAFEQEHGGHGTRRSWPTRSRCSYANDQGVEATRR